MSDIPADYTDRLNIREQIARIDRNQAEIGKLLAEQTKLTAEQAKFTAEQAKFTVEQIKLAAEADKFRRDRFLAPMVALAATLGGIAALAPTILRSLGVH